MHLVLQSLGLARLFIKACAQTSQYCLGCALPGILLSAVPSTELCQRLHSQSLSSVARLMVSTHNHIWWQHASASQDKEGKKGTAPDLQRI
jgi:hypothetical protein